METQVDTRMNIGKGKILLSMKYALWAYNSIFFGERNLPHSTFSLTPLRTAFIMLDMLLNKPQMVQG